MSKHLEYLEYLEMTRRNWVWQAPGPVLNSCKVLFVDICVTLELRYASAAIVLRIQLLLVADAVFYSASLRICTLIRAAAPVPRTDTVQLERSAQAVHYVLDP